MTIAIQKYIMDLFTLRSIITVVAIAALVAILIAISKKTVLNTRTLAYGALSIGLAYILSFFKVFDLPNGGSITIASMLPIFIFAYISGARAGIMAGLCYGMLQLTQGAFIVNWVQFLLDYPIAFAVLGLAGNMKKNIFLGAIVGSAARFICHFLSGVIFFASYAGDQNVLLYSFLYNISYLLPDTLICIGILLIPSIRMAINRVKVASVE